MNINNQKRGEKRLKEIQDLCLNLKVCNAVVLVERSNFLMMHTPHLPVYSTVHNSFILNAKTDFFTP